MDQPETNLHESLQVNLQMATAGIVLKDSGIQLHTDHRIAPRLRDLKPAIGSNPKQANVPMLIRNTINSSCG